MIAQRPDKHDLVVWILFGGLAAPRDAIRLLQALGYPTSDIDAARARFEKML